jgi:hypothetical protein
MLYAGRLYAFVRTAVPVSVPFGNRAIPNLWTDLDDCRVRHFFENLTFSLQLWTRRSVYGTINCGER